MLNTFMYTDVGGGSVKNDVVYSLANPSLRWMISETIREGAGIIFKEKLLKSFGVDPATGESTLRYDPVVQKGRDIMCCESSLELQISLTTGKRDGEISDSPVQVGGITLTPHRNRTLDKTRRHNSMLQEPGATREPLGDLSITNVHYGAIPQTTTGGEPPYDSKASFTSVSIKKQPMIIAAEQHKNPNYQDALSPSFDQLERNPVMWWPMELIPMRQYYQDHQGEWHRGWM